MSLIKKIFEKRKWLRSIFSTIYFNFHYLPFKQAFLLPIILYKPNLKKLKGQVLINSKKIKPGMILLGFPRVSLYPDTGIVFENHGGKCIFMGRCNIGNASAISIGSKGNLIFGDNFSATTSAKLVSYTHLEFKDNVIVGWDNIFTDTDLHKMTKLDGTFTKGHGTILIGSNNWFGARCTILKNTQTPDYCSVGANSVLNKNYDFPSYVVIGGNPTKVKATGIYLDNTNHQITY